MSFASLLNQSIVIERASAGVVAGPPQRPLLDDYGQPVLVWATLATVAGSIQPKKAIEVPIQSQGGATITTYVVYLEPTDITGADRVRRAADTNGPYYQLTGKPRDAAGRGHHLECDAELVG